MQARNDVEVLDAKSESEPCSQRISIARHECLSTKRRLSWVVATKTEFLKRFPLPVSGIVKAYVLHAHDERPKLYMPQLHHVIFRLEQLQYTTLCMLLREMQLAIRANDVVHMIDSTNAMAYLLSHETNVCFRPKNVRSIVRIDQQVQETSTS